MMTFALNQLLTGQTNDQPDTDVHLLPVLLGPMISRPHDATGVLSCNWIVSKRWIDLVFGFFVLCFVFVFLSNDGSSDPSCPIVVLNEIVLIEDLVLSSCYRASQGKREFIKGFVRIYFRWKCNEAIYSCHNWQREVIPVMLTKSSWSICSYERSRSLFRGIMGNSRTSVHLCITVCMKV